MNRPQAQDPRRLAKWIAAGAMRPPQEPKYEEFKPVASGIDFFCWSLMSATLGLVKLRQYYDDYVDTSGVWEGWTTMSEIRRRYREGPDHKGKFVVTLLSYRNEDVLYDRTWVEAIGVAHLSTQAMVALMQMLGN